MRNKKVFQFKEFSVHHDRSTMKVGTDGVLLGAWVNVNGAKRILDVGTGSGVIALMLAQRTPSDVIIDALDNSVDDFIQAKENFLASRWKDKINAHHESFQNFNSPFQYDCIVSNPPYFSNSLEPPDVKRKSVRHTLTLSFDELLASSVKHLKPSGKLNLILPFTEGEEFISLASKRGLHCNRKVAFRTRATKAIERLLLEFSKEEIAVHESEILLYKESNAISAGYRSLTQDFYINF